MGFYLNKQSLTFLFYIDLSVTQSYFQQ